jgi:nucleotidyltransferase/DNA polymerase involved in DNA repair
VLDCCALAAAAGVTPGSGKSQAEALCPTARFGPAREELYRAAHDALAAAAGHFTPAVETAGLGLLFAEVSGLERRCGPDPQLAHHMAQAAGQALRPGSGQALRLGSGQASEWDVRVGVGSGKFVAAQAARAARPGSGCAVPPGEERAFLSSLPLSALPADAEMLPPL